MDEQRRGPGRGQRRRDLPRDVTAFAHPGDDQPSPHRRADIKGEPERAIERLRQLLEPLDFGADHPPADRDVLRQQRRLSEPPQPGQCLMRRDGDYSIPQSTVPLIAIIAPDRRAPAGPSSMRENVLLSPALEVKQRTIW